MRLPQRHSLVLEIVDILREDIDSQRWHGYMPSERELCRSLHVSRPTLSKALKVLEREGLLIPATKSRRKIVSEFVPEPKRKGAVILLLPQELERMELHTVLWINRLQADMANVDRDFSICVDERAFSKNCGVHLARVTRSKNVSCWVVPSTTRSMQQWFLESKLPVIVVGSCFSGITLHSVDLDSYAVGLHAAGMLLSKGHRSLCLVAAGKPYGGEKLIESGFLDACRSHTNSKVQAEVIKHNGSTEGLSRSLSRLFQTKGAPTAYFISGAHETLTTISWLSQQKLRMGVEYALISRNDDAFLTHLVPSIPCYTHGYEKLSVALIRLVERILKESNISPVSVKVIPEFKPGGALIPLKEQ